MPVLNRNYCPPRQFRNADWYPHGLFGPGPVSSVGCYDVAVWCGRTRHLVAMRGVAGDETTRRLAYHGRLYNSIIQTSMLHTNDLWRFGDLSNGSGVKLLQRSVNFFNPIFSSVRRR